MKNLEDNNAGGKQNIVTSHRHYIPTYFHSFLFAVIKGLSIYRHVAKCSLIQEMSQNLLSITEWRCRIYGLQQNVTKYNGI